MRPVPEDKWIEWVLRALYSAALYLLLPITVYHLIWRGFRQREYFNRWNERYGVYGQAQSRGTRIWVHAVSVGEVNAAAPLVNALLTSRPDLRILVTTITPTGSARVLTSWGSRVDHVYLPYDLPGAVSRFLLHFKPRIALILETELWPNLLLGCRDHDVPVYVVNARLSERSLNGYRLIAPLMRRALRTVDAVLAQTTADRARFIALGANSEAAQVTGNLKFDVAHVVLPAFATTFATTVGGRPAWIAASTHPDEEAAVVAIHRRLRERWPDLLLLWAPRHPERFKPVTQKAVAAGWRVSTRHLTQWPDRNDGVFVIDTLGELMAFYGCARVAFVGGSLEPVGGHNLLEPAAAGTAVVTGPHLHNFRDIADQLEHVGALRIGADADAVGMHIAQLLADADARARMVDAAHALVAEGRGALQRTLAAIARHLPAQDTSSQRAPARGGPERS
jgi:3-deoxy-D-manno-octulosonic-acid transferase